MRTKPQILIEFGSRLRQLRKAENISQEELADRAGLHRTYIGMIERAEKNITLINIEKLSIALNVTITDFFYGRKNSGNI
ncbi:helix-turn-helix domain-containing protein [Maribacter sp. 2308TA10-17]|uniref:helix-turn-helix domain-containing protein n=1 Tax=Maribacter sp. 2308TA10-17 TaxID=3386276 RepID=UPI0039BD06F5